MTISLAECWPDGRALLTPAEVADILVCSDRHVRTLIETRRLPAVDIGAGRRREWRVGRTQLEQYLDGVTV